MFRALADFANGTSDSVWIFVQLYSITDFNQRRLVKQKMATIFKPNLCQALTSYTVDSSQGIFGGMEQVTKTLEDSKKQNLLIKGGLLASKKTGKAGIKSRKNKGKKRAAGEPKPRVAIKAPKIARKVPVARMPKPTRAPVTPRRRRSPLLRKRTKRNHVSLFLLIIHPAIPPFLSRVSVEPV